MRTERRNGSAGPVQRGAATTRRCAVYTRKSSEEGLEQAFNSLHAQREACEAFVRSQRHEGWALLPTLYDDGGLSGGTLERPALQRLLADVRAGRVDLVVVYKVDRLTRSLAGFAKIVEVFDSHGASFVSVTQQFNTATSMGRLTLNMLLSFAQFEREVTGERIRDKIAASKRKGLWMGGTVPLGYDVRDRKLVVNQGEADTVRHVFRSYLALGSVRLLQERLALEGVRGKGRLDAAGEGASGGQPLSRGALYTLLRNRLYRGEVAHKGAVHPGEHAAIIDQPLWDAVQARLAENQAERRSGESADSPSLLVGLLHDGSGGRLTPSHANKGGRRYRYYVSHVLVTGSRDAAPTGRRVPAGDLERLVSERVRRFLASGAEVLAALRPAVSDAAEQCWLLDRAVQLAQAWPELTAPEQRTILRGLLGRIELRAGRLDLHLLPSHLPRLLRGEADRDAQPLAADAGPQAPPLILPVPAALRRAGREMALVVGAGPGAPPAPDPALLRLILKAQALWDVLLRGGAAGLGELAGREGVSGSYATRLVRAAFLAPDILAAILDGKHPEGLTAARLLQECRRGLPLDWREQRAALGFG
jgi:DNA invertase Pin-like site-specific DNA recombinase